MAGAEDNLEIFLNTIGAIHSMKEDLDAEYYAGINKILQNESFKKVLERTMEAVTDHTGTFLHNISKKKPGEEVLRKMINAVPLSLSYKNGDGQLPIHSAVWDTASVPYVPILAEEGMKYNVGGEEKRGGLLIDDPTYEDKCNILQILVARTEDHSDVNDDQLEYIDSLHLTTLKELRASNMLRKEDIIDNSLLYWSCHPKCQLRFDYLLDSDPTGLRTHKYNGLPLIHAVIDTSKIELLSAFLKISLKRHPEDLGLLFQTHTNGETACERAFNKLGKEKVFNEVIGDCIPSHDPQLPILHHVVQSAPKFMDYFSKRYAAASYLRDPKGRTLRQAILASGTMTYDKNVFFFLDMSDAQVREVDPGNDLYPFMVAAHCSDLSAGYHLLRRDPSLLIGLKKM